MEHVADELRQPDLANWSRPAGDDHDRGDGRLVEKQHAEAELGRLQEAEREDDSCIRPPLVDQTFVKQLD